MMSSNQIDRSGTDAFAEGRQSRRHHRVDTTVKCGTKPQRSRSRWRSPLSGCRRTTMAAWVGATFQDGAMLGMSPTVWNASRIAAGPWKLANLPHITEA